VNSLACHISFESRSNRSTQQEQLSLRWFVIPLVNAPDQRQLALTERITCSPMVFSAGKASAKKLTARQEFLNARTSKIGRLLFAGGPQSRPQPPIWRLLSALPPRWDDDLIRWGTGIVERKEWGVGILRDMVKESQMGRAPAQLP
jgi:hypothetical protein